MPGREGRRTSRAEIAAFPLCARGAGEGMTSGVRPSAEGGGDAGEPGVGGGLTSGARWQAGESGRARAEIAAWTRGGVLGRRLGRAQSAAERVSRGGGTADTWARLVRGKESARGEGWAAGRECGPDGEGGRGLASRGWVSGLSLD